MSTSEEALLSAFNTEYFDGDGVPAMAQRVWPDFKAGWDAALAYSAKGAADIAVAVNSASTNKQRDAITLCERAVELYKRGYNLTSREWRFLLDEMAGVA